MTYPIYPIVITKDQLVTAGVCEEGIRAFDDAAPSGTLAIVSVADHAALLTGPLAEWEDWAQEEGILPPVRVIAGDYGIATAGTCGIATAGTWGFAMAGDDGTATAGYRGTATAGAGGTATAGDDGTATAGAWGSATAGEDGTAMAGDGGTATAGDGGTLAIRWHDGVRYRIAIAYVGEGGIEPGVSYRLDERGAFKRA